MKTKFIVQSLISLLVLAFGAWAFYEYKKSQTEKQQKEEKSYFLNQIQLEDLKAFRIVKKDKKLWGLQEGKNWVLKEPVQDLASFTEISRWLAELKNQKIQKIKIKGETFWKDYHLDKAPFVEMELNNGEKIVFSVSNKSSFDGKYFIKKGEELFVGESYFYSEVNGKDFKDFRNKRLLPPLGHALKIQFQGKSAFTLNWADYKWSLDQAQKFPLDSRRLDGFWTDINSLKAEELREPISPSALKKYELHKPQLKITLSYPEEDKKYILKLSPLKKERAFVSVSHRNFILELSKESAEKLILSLQDIRDHGFPFNYKKTPVSQIEKSGKTNSWTVEKDKEAWQALKPKDKTVDSEKVDELLDKIRKLEGEKYKTGPSEKSLRSLRIKGPEAELVFELKEVSANNSQSWVKTNLWAELVALSKSSLDEIFNHNVFLDPAPEKEKKSSHK